MKRFIYASGFIAVALVLVYLSGRANHEPVAPWLVYTMGAALCVFVVLLVYSFLQRRRHNDRSRYL